MISKKKAIIGAIIIVIVVTALNVTVGNLIAIELRQKVVISKDTYEFYRQIRDEYGKMLALKEYIEKNYYRELDNEKLMEGAIRGMFQGIGDPYTTYMSAAEYQELMTRTQGSYGGIGVIVTPGTDGYVTVVSPIEGTPGERAGLVTGDKIISVDGEPIFGEKLEQAVDLMRGEAGTQVRLSIWREGLREPFDVLIEREIIRLLSVRSEVIEGDIGYIRISTFDEQTASDFKDHIENLQKQNIKGIIIDLRNNPGGLLSQCIAIADMLLGEQIIVYTEDRHGRIEQEKSKRKHIDLPLAILVNKGSASASEILAGAVKDGERGLIIGTTTFGKGLVQQLKKLPDGTGFKYTISQYFTPNGHNIHGTGIEPDIVVELREGEETDTQLEKAIEVIKQKIYND